MNGTRSVFVSPAIPPAVTLLRPALLGLMALLAIAPAGSAQDAASPAAVAVSLARTAAELEQLLGPIALYPDALIALILPASTAPADVVLAARQLRANPGDLSQIESRSWEESVKSLARYPEVLKWMDENLEWTKQVGEAFLVQPAEVMNALQRLRAKARAAGTLVDTPQQQIIASSDVIRIVPVQRDRIFVPSYDPTVVYVPGPTYSVWPPVSFGTGFAVGSWLAYDCDWTQRKVWVGDRHRPWRGHDWHRPVVGVEPSRPVNHWRAPLTPGRPGLRGNRPLDTTLVTPDAPVSPGSRRTFRPGSSNVAPLPDHVTNGVAGPENRRANPGSRPPNSNAPRNAGNRGRSLPNTIPDVPAIQAAPPLATGIQPLPMHRSRGFPLSGIQAPPLPGTVAPSLPMAAPPLPPVVPYFHDSPPATFGPPPSNAAPDYIPRSRRNGREQLD